MRFHAVCTLLLLAAACDDSSPQRPPPRYPYRGPYPYPAQPAPGPAPAPAQPTGPSLTPAQISATVNAAYPSFSSCYQKSESFMTGKSGTVTIFFDVAPQGNVLRASDQAPPGVAPQGNPLHDAQLVQCLDTTFMGLRFQVAGDSTSASWTFSFSP